MPNRSYIITYMPIASLKWKSLELTDIDENWRSRPDKESTAYN